MARIINHAGVTIAEADSDYDSLAVGQLEELSTLLLDAAREADPPIILLDLSETQYIGSSFLGVVMRAWKRLRDRHGRLAVCNVNDVCGDVLRASKLDTIWEVFADRATALEELESRS
jgi:anti-sigma B factor antagonist